MAKRKPKGGGGKKCLIAAALILLPASAMSQATQCQQFSDGTIVCYPVGGGSTYGK